jgi:hypothetical protein
MVFGCYFGYTGLMTWLDENYQNNQKATLTAEVVGTEQGIAQSTRNYQPFPTSTRLPGCESYRVSVSSAFVRQCPSLTCQAVTRYGEGAEVCVLGRAVDNEFFDAADWYEIDVNKGELFLDLGYMHESVLEPMNPTPRPSKTFTPLPTVTLTPSPKIPTSTIAPDVTGSPTSDAVEF